MFKNRLTYLLVLGTLAMLVYLYEDGMTYAALYMVLALPAVSFLLALLSRRRFWVGARLVDSTIVKGDTTQFVLIIHNRGFMPIHSVRARFMGDCPAIETDFADQYLSVWPFKSQEMVFNITAKYRGEYEVGAESVVMYDFLGIFKFKQKNIGLMPLMVRPRVVDIAALPLAVAASGADDVKDYNQQEDYALISDLRKYQPTDGYKKIHWKMSAKKNELVSKNFQSTKSNTAAFVIDNSIMPMWGEERMALEDAMMEGLVSALSHCVARRQLCSLYFLGSDNTQDYTANFEYLYSLASGITFEKFEMRDFDAYFANYARMQLDVENLIVFVREINDAVYAAAQSLKLFGNNVIIFYYHEAKGVRQGDRIARLREMDIHCWEGVQ